MVNKTTNTSPHYLILNKILNGLKRGKRKFFISEFESEFRLEHGKVVSIIYEIDEYRIGNDKRCFIKNTSQNEKGRPHLSEIEIAADDEEGVAKQLGEIVKRNQAAERKKAKVIKVINSSLKDMRLLKPGKVKKYLLLSDSKNNSWGIHDHAKKASAQRV